MSKTNGNDAAYPAGQSIHSEYGLTKRELFAAMAMQGMLAHSTRYQPHNPGTPWMVCMGVEATRLADALIAALNAEKSE